MNSLFLVKILEIINQDQWCHKGGRGILRPERTKKAQREQACMWPYRRGNGVTGEAVQQGGKVSLDLNALGIEFIIRSSLSEQRRRCLVSRKCVKLHQRQIDARKQPESGKLSEASEVGKRYAD